MTHNVQPDRVQQLHAAAPTKEVNSLIPLDYYYRSARLLLQQVRWFCGGGSQGIMPSTATRSAYTPPHTCFPPLQAEAYRQRGNTDQLYVMLLRFVSLVVETVPRHHAFNAARLDPGYLRLRQACRDRIDELAALKAQLKLTNAAALRDAPYLPTKAPGTVQLGAGHVPGLHWDGAAANELDLSALEHLGTPQWEAAAATKPSAPPPPPPPRPAAPMVQLPNLTSSLALPAASQATLDKHALMPLGLTSSAAAGQQAELPLYSHLLHSLNGSSVSPSAPPLDARLTALDLGHGALPPPVPSPYCGQLQLGPQEVAVQSAPHPIAPLVPGEACCQPPTDGGMVPLAAPTNGVSEVKKRQQVRDVHISAALMDEFLRYALSNTRRNVETCGILAGALSPDDARFTVTALIVPKQEGSSDTVQALAEEEIFEAQDSRALYPLGWIHTHPSQTCFLSSIDIHTQCGYQVSPLTLFLSLSIYGHVDVCFGRSGLGGRE